METAKHLRRIRIRLTVIFSVIMAVALGVVTVLVIDADRRVRDSEVSSELLTTAQRGAQALYFNEEGDLDARDFEAADTLLWSYPQLWVFHVDEDAHFGVSAIAGPAENYYPDADPEQLEEYAAAVIFEREVSPWDVHGGGELTLRARGVALTDNEGDPFRAAVIAIADTNDFLAGNDGFTTRVILIVTSFFVLTTGGGYLLAGRSMRPTAVALEQQERLIADAAHELRTPVARIRAAAEGGLAADEPPDEALERVVTLSGDAGQAIDDLLTLARMDAGRQEVLRESLRLDLLAEAVADRYEEVSVEAVPTVVEGDASLLGRAIDNLLRNAVQHGRREDPATPITVTVYPNLVRVADTGPGVADEELAHLFERFRSRPGSSGHGLGLPIAAWVARAHRGDPAGRRRRRLQPLPAHLVPEQVRRGDEKLSLARRVTEVEAEFLEGRLREKRLPVKIYDRHRLIVLVRGGETAHAASGLVGCSDQKAELWVHRFNASGFSTCESHPNHVGRPLIIDGTQGRALGRVALSRPVSINAQASAKSPRSSAWTIRGHTSGSTP